MPLIKSFEDGTIIEYDRGGFDDYCVYLRRPSCPRYPPRDVEYFAQLQQLSRQYGNQRVYQDFVAVYDRTGKAIDPQVLESITLAARSYGEGERALELDIVLTTLYAGMVAEERKANTRLGKRIKRLGVHQVVCEAIAPDEAANFSRGRNWRWIADQCASRGF